MQGAGSAFQSPQQVKAEWRGAGILLEPAGAGKVDGVELVAPSEGAIERPVSPRDGRHGGTRLRDVHPAERRFSAGGGNQWHAIDGRGYQRRERRGVVDHQADVVRLRVSRHRQPDAATHAVTLAGPPRGGEPLGAVARLIERIERQHVKVGGESLAVSSDEAQRRLVVRGEGSQRLELQPQSSNIGGGHLFAVHPTGAKSQHIAEIDRTQGPARVRLLERVEVQHGVLARLTQSRPGAALQPALDEVGRVSLCETGLDEPQAAARLGQNVELAARPGGVQRGRRIRRQHGVEERTTVVVVEIPRLPRPGEQDRVPRTLQRRYALRDRAVVSALIPAVVAREEGQCPAHQHDAQQWDCETRAAVGGCTRREVDERRPDQQVARLYGLAEQHGGADRQQPGGERGDQHETHCGATWHAERHERDQCSSGQDCGHAVRLRPRRQLTPRVPQRAGYCWDVGHIERREGAADAAGSAGDSERQKDDNAKYAHCRTEPAGGGAARRSGRHDLRQHREQAGVMDQRSGSAEQAVAGPVAGAATPAQRAHVEPA
ncbi:MAG: hypothetical protein AVDCRST_MAG77-3267 [uncultured Chloroflexi bacterium]|uniref:Uncharacterized protein n=1 Tax=uncultured Chloroflexota bacterium TaxID=166587 RepID=A0A6J4J637_9CHLR|nr:MAG: hypothetical protein AVDCRST_MAG77-3267 [uncultured Chloroflexota bacterium]